MEWAEYLAFERSPGSLPMPCFVYLPLRAGLSAALVGPLGTASTAEICFQSNALFSIEWQYSGDDQPGAHARWMRSDESRLRLGGRLLMSTRDVSNGVLFTLCGVGSEPPACDGEITVRLQRPKAP